MPRAAVLGAPIAHSLSPALHRAAYAHLGLTDWTYEAIYCDAGGLPAILQSVRADEDWAGLSLTMPLKIAVLELLDQLDEKAAQVGAVNTVIRCPDGRLAGYNTDIAGAKYALSCVGGTSLPAEVVLIGGGGSARAVLAALADGGVTRARVVMRDTARGRSLADLGSVLGVRTTLIRWSSLADEVAAAALVVSTVPSATFGLANWPARASLFDLTYDPWPTPLITLAHAGGAHTVGGLEMLAAQAAEQVEYMTGQSVSVEVLIAAGAAELAARTVDGDDR